MITSKISSKGQITLPSRVRQALHVQPGERVLFLIEDETVLLRSLGPSSARGLAGALRRYAGGRTLDAPRSIVKTEVARAAAQEG